MLLHQIIESVSYRELPSLDKRRLAIWGARSSRYMKHSDDFGDTLNKLPTYKGTIYRGMRLLPQTIKRYRPGKTFELRNHASATKWPDLAASYAEMQLSFKKLPVVWEIKQQSAANFSSRYWHPEAGELVLKRGTRYAIERVSEKKGIVVISLSEIV